MGAPSPRPIVRDVGHVTAAAIEVDRLARLHVAARRVGCELRFCNASRELCELIDFMGLSAVLRVEPVGQPEEREERLRLEKERELDDPPA